MGIAANSFSGATIPVVDTLGFKNGLYQSFVQDPETAGASFIPKPVPFAVGANLRKAPASFVRREGAMDPAKRLGPLIRPGTASGR